MKTKNDLYIKPSSDIFIKYLFGMDTEESRELLLSFINAVLQNSDFDPIVSVVPKNPFNYKEFINDKESVLDIDAKDEQGREYNIEVQTSGDSNFKTRSLYYWADLYKSQLEESEKYKKLNPVICINILDYLLLPELPGIHNYFMILEGRKREYILTNHLVIHFIELPKLKLTEMTGKISKWMLFLKYEGSNEKMIKTLLEGDSDMEKAHEKYVSFTQDDDMRRLYRARLKARRDAEYRLDNATEQGLEKGFKQGLEKGELLEKQHVLIRQADKKFGISGEDKQLILSVSNFEKLDAALDEIISAGTFKDITSILNQQP